MSDSGTPCALISSVPTIDWVKGIGSNTSGSSSSSSLIVSVMFGESDLPRFESNSSTALGASSTIPSFEGDVDFLAVFVFGAKQMHKMMIFINIERKEDVFVAHFSYTIDTRITAIA